MDLRDVPEYEKELVMKGSNVGSQNNPNTIFFNNIAQTSLDLEN